MRMDFDEYCMEVAETVAKRSTCLRRQVGAVIVVGKHIVATGYNGAAAELDHCDEKGECRRNILGIASGTDLMNCEAVHSEANAIIQCAVHATSPAGGTLLQKAFPAWTGRRIWTARAAPVLQHSAYIPCWTQAA